METALLYWRMSFMSKIDYDFLKGGIIKEVVKSLLQRYGYEVYPYGYETTFSALKSKLADEGVRTSPSVRRMKSTPDLVVFDKKRKNLMFVEVKMRTSLPVAINSHVVKGYQDFWNECILVLVVPDENVFYAQRVSDLQLKEKYNPDTDFCEIREFFPDIDEYEFLDYRNQTRDLLYELKQMKSRRY
jgi:hypothetical protein